MQSLNGNTATVGSAQGRTKWESSAHAPGLSVANIDELELPPNAVAIQLRADQVCTGATGISLCNCTFLKAKLDAIGGSYLCLIVPGTIGVDLKNMLQSARPGLLPNCVQGRLTLSDPATNRTFVKQVVLINLGTTPVKFAQLDDTVAVQDDSSLSVWFHGYQRQSPDEWHSTIRPTLSDSRDMLRKRIAGILGIEVSNLETWNVVVTADPPAFRGCLRVADSQAKKLYNCKDNLIFFRPFISQNLKPQPEDGGIVIMWTKFETLPALALVANTLDGAHGFVSNGSNGHSLGVRINKTSVRHARSVLQKPNPRICETNQNVFGTSTYEISGFPPGISAATVVAMLHSTTDGSKWKSWDVIPLKHIQRYNMSVWIVKADQEPSLERLITGKGEFKLVIRKMLNKQELSAQRKQQNEERAARAKAIRREQVLSKTYHSPMPDYDIPDHWQAYRDKQEQRKGKGKGKSKPEPLQTRQETAASSSNELQQIREDLSALTQRVNTQEIRLDQFQNQMSLQHNEVMQALTALGAAGSSQSGRPDRSSARKRQPDIQNTPLKAIADAKDSKVSRV